MSFSRVNFILPALAVSVLAPIAFQSCGYSLQTSNNDLYHRKGIRRLYVAPFVNNSYKPGVENMIYNSVMRSLSAGRRFILVDSPLKADAILISSVEDANYSASATNAAHSLPPSTVTELSSVAHPEGYRADGSPIPNPKFDDMPVATEYRATVTCSFKIEAVGAQVTGWTPQTPTVEDMRQAALPVSQRSAEYKNKVKPGEIIWAQNISRQQPYQAYNQLGAFGTTSPLMNESEFTHAIQELSGLLANDMHDSMFQAF